MNIILSSLPDCVSFIIHWLGLEEVIQKKPRTRNGAEWNGAMRRGVGVALLLPLPTASKMPNG